MKRLFMISLMLLFLPLFALAEGADITCDVHPEVKEFFSQEKFQSLTVTNYIVAQGTKSGDYAFAIGRKNDQNLIYGFEKKNGVFQYWLVSGTALPRQEGTFSLWTEEEWTYYSASEGHSQYVRGPVLMIEWHDKKDETQILLIYANEGASGQWRLKYVNQVSTNKETPVFSMLVYEDHLHYLSQSGKSLGKAEGYVQTNMRYLNLSSLPASLTAAQNKLSTAPAVPWGSELVGQEISFPGGQKFPVYSGPGTNYVRAAGGKATVSTNDWIQVFGTENGFALIQYAISANHMRFGYIDEKHLPQGHNVPALTLENAAATMVNPCALTDDPLYSRQTVRQMEGGEEVIWLAQLGNDVYIETKGENPQRGFVHLDNVARHIQDFQQTATLENDRYKLTAILTLQGGETRVDMLLEFAQGETHLPDGYAALCNQKVSAWSDMPGVESPVIHSFSMLIPDVDENTRIIALCPMYDGQYAFDEVIQFILP